jgi:hypothetical protein
MNKGISLIIVLCIFCICSPTGAQIIPPGTPLKQAAVFEWITTNPISEHTVGVVNASGNGFITLYPKTEYAGKIIKLVYQVCNTVLRSSWNADRFVIFKGGNNGSECVVTYRVPCAWNYDAEPELYL